MNIDLIRKVITASGDVCPEIIYDNPLLDKTVAKTLSKSLINILKQSRGTTNFNRSLRHSLLGYIRSICKVQQKDHFNVDENVMQMITETYIEDLRTKTQDSNTDQCLDNFLIKEMKSMNITSIFNSDNDVEVIQALINLNEYGTNMEFVYENILNWNVTDKNSKLLKKLWKNDCTNNSISDSLSIKIKSEIESLILDICQKILTDKNMDIPNTFEDQRLDDLSKKCSKSPYCFQICCGILNSIFVSTHFNSEIESFIKHFILNIKSNFSSSMSSLYQNSLKPIVIILDTDMSLLSETLRDKYSESAVKLLKELHENSEGDLIMLLSHYPQWFDIYTHTLNTS